jgi:predicted nucleotidyltransferase component of viral defense system
LSTPANPYHEQLRLLVQLLSFVRTEECFALKGGTAINLFYRDLPRYSVDIDLTYLPGETFANAQKGIDKALSRIARRLSSGSPSYPVTRGSGQGGGPIDTLTVNGLGAQVKIEVNPVLRGALEPTTDMKVRSVVSDTFGFAETKVLSFDDVYAGKLVAALDRQHPRDLFDVKLLLENEGLSDNLFRAFIVYLVGHKGSIPDVLDPLGKRVDFEGLYKGQLAGMTSSPVSLEALLKTRGQLEDAIRARLTDDLKQFLLSVQQANPQWELLAVKGAESLPAVKWRMHNLAKMKPDAMSKELKRLERVLAK